MVALHRATLCFKYRYSDNVDLNGTHMPKRSLRYMDLRAGFFCVYLHFHGWLISLLTIWYSLHYGSMMQYIKYLLLQFIFAFLFNSSILFFCSITSDITFSCCLWLLIIYCSLIMCRINEDCSGIGSRRGTAYSIFLYLGLWQVTNGIFLRLFFRLTSMYLIFWESCLGYF